MIDWNEGKKVQYTQRGGVYSENEGWHRYEILVNIWNCLCFFISTLKVPNFKGKVGFCGPVVISGLARRYRYKYHCTLVHFPKSPDSWFRVLVTNPITIIFTRVHLSRSPKLKRHSFRIPWTFKRWTLKDRPRKLNEQHKVLSVRLNYLLKERVEKSEVITLRS